MKLHRKLMATAGALALTVATGVVVAQEKGQVEVLHWWTSGGEAAALNVLKEDLQAKGIGWQDMPVAGGGGEQAMTVLRARVTAGNPPTAVQMLGFDIRDWAEQQGVVADLSDTAKAEGWAEVVPEAVQFFSSYDGAWIAAPVNVHSTNWIWANKKIFDELGLSEPTTWDELIATLDKIKEAGHVPLAHGGQAWQDATIFDAVVNSTGGIEFYRAALVDLDPEALGSDTMKEVFDRMAKLRTYVDDNFSGRDWNLATAMVIEGKAGMQMMGDWAKGEFINAGQTPGAARNPRRLACVRRLRGPAGRARTGRAGARPGARRVSAACRRALLLGRLRPGDLEPVAHPADARDPLLAELAPQVARRTRRRCSSPGRSRTPRRGSAAARGRAPARGGGRTPRRERTRAR